MDSIGSCDPVQHVLYGFGARLSDNAGHQVIVDGLDGAVGSSKGTDMLRWKGIFGATRRNVRG
jgi:hypothetical protein